MALLPNFAKRLNDIEIASGAPITEILMRKFGSNVNFLLDFLGVSENETATSGALSDFVNALTFVENNPISLEVNLGTGLVNVTNQAIGTYAFQKYVNQYFYAVYQNTDSNNVSHAIHNYFVSPGTESTMSYLTKVEMNFDSSGWSTLAATQRMGNRQASPSFVLLDPDRASLHPPNHYKKGQATSIELFSSWINQGYTGLVQIPPGTRLFHPFCVLDWRDFGTQAEVRLDINSGAFGGFINVSIYREVKLDVGSLGL